MKLVRNLSLAAIMLIAFIAIATAKKAERLATYQPVTIVKPQVGDTLDAPHRFKTEQLLNTVSIIDLMEENPLQIVNADNEGFVSLSSTPEGNIAIESFSTSIRPERFMKGKLKVTAPGKFEVFVDNVSKGTKSSVQDTVNSSSTLSVNVDLEPEWVHQISIKYLNDNESKAKPSIKVEFVPLKEFEDVAFELDPQLKKRFNIHNISDGKRVTSATVSPDGRYVLCKYQETFSAKEKRNWASVYDIKTGKDLNLNLSYFTNWMPTGSVLYSTRTNQSKTYDIVTTTIPGMITEVVATNIPVVPIIWAPDASYFLYYNKVDGAKLEGVMKKYNNPDDRIPGERDRHYLVKYELKTKVSQPLTYGGLSTNLTSFSPDGKKILYTTSKYVQDKYPLYFTSLIELDVNTLKADTIINSDGALKDAIYSPDGNQLFITAGADAFNGISAKIGDHPIANDYDVQGFIYDLASRTATPITIDFNPSIKGRPIWNKVDNNIYFLAVEGFEQPIYQYNTAKKIFTRLPFGIENVSNFSIGADEAQWISAVGQGYSYAGRAELLNLKSMKTTVIDDPYSTELASTNLGKTEQWKFTASDGTEIDGYFCLPPDFDANKKYPLIVYYYGGTTPSNKHISHSYSPQLFASRDYVVYVLNPSGTIGYGQEFSARHVNAWGKRTADDIIEGVKEFCRTHPYVNDKKIGCLGASYGGFMTQYLQTQTDMFAAAVSHAGISNVTSYWGEGYWGYSYNVIAAAKSYPWTDPELFTKQGSLFNADKIKTPLLLLHGTEDTNVPIGESIQLFNALRLLGKDVEFITVEGQNHVITDYDKRMLWHATIMAWFAKYLQDDPRWWNSLYGK